MNTVILSGGSGNDALIRGLTRFIPATDIHVITNAYDNGKSTGVCRYVTDTLGVSDIRKNHYRMYKATHTEIDPNLEAFYSGRFDFTAGQELPEIVEKLTQWQLTSFIPYVESFFSTKKSKEQIYFDFSVANIVYSQMYAELGYKVTNKLFCDLLGIPDFVELNSFDNVYLTARTASGALLTDEGDIVEYKNANDKIVGTSYQGDVNFSLNPDAIKLLEEAELIIISTGTFWSSIYPTLDYGDFYQVINRSAARKIWVMNNNEDKDAYGVSSVEFIQYAEDLGLDLSDVTILLNNDATEFLKQTDDKHNFRFFNMGNLNGKHDEVMYVEALLKTYYNIEHEDSDASLILDFDDTIWARDPLKVCASLKNITLLNAFNDVTIITGNSYSSVYDKLCKVYGSTLTNFNFDIWADANSTLYRHNQKQKHLTQLDFEDTQKMTDLGLYLKQEFDFNVVVTDYCIKIKPLTEVERKLLVMYVNDYLMPSMGITDAVALKTGKTSVDILKVINDKVAVFDEIHGKSKKHTVYIGDECYHGNDSKICRLCDKAFNVSSVEETALILTLLKGA